MEIKLDDESLCKLNHSFLQLVTFWSTKEWIFGPIVPVRHTRLYNYIERCWAAKGECSMIAGAFDQRLLEPSPKLKVAAQRVKHWRVFEQFTQDHVL